MSASIAPPARYSGAQRQEASDWFVIIHAEVEPSGDTLQAWLRWMEQDEGNRLAFESIVAAWHSTPRSSALSMPAAGELLADDYDGEQSVAEWLAARQSAPATPAGAGVRPRRFTRTHRAAWLAAASLGVIIVGLLIMSRLSGLRDSRSDVFTTKAGEQIEITLADGSRVWLGPRSTLNVRFTPQRRGIQLTTGEAFFSVKKDRSRPFVVHSTGGDITAVGTAFNVRAVTEHVTVSVSEGVVAVAPGAALARPTHDELRVASGQQLTFTARESVRSLTIASSPSPGERARWRDGVLIYRDEPLRDVVMDVARYSDKQLEISGDMIGDMHYTGVVYRGAIDEWTTALPESFPVKVVREGNREVIVAR